MISKNTLKKLMPLIGIAIFIYILINIGPAKIAITLSKIPIFILIMVLIITFTKKIITSYMWNQTLKAQKINLKLMTTLKYLIMGQFYGLIAPGQSGQYLRLIYVKKDTNEPYGKLFINSTIDIILGIIPLYLILIVSGFFYGRTYPGLYTPALIFIIANLILYVILLKKQRTEKIINLLVKICIFKRIKKAVLSFSSTFYNDFPPLQKLIKPLLFGFICQLLCFIQLYLLSVALDIEIPIMIQIVIYTLASIFAFLPTSYLGLGIQQGILVFMYGLYGVAPEKVISLSLVFTVIAKLTLGMYGFIVIAHETKASLLNIHKINKILKKPITIEQ